MCLTITREQRDAIYEVVVNHLSAIGDEFVEDSHLMSDRLDLSQRSRSKDFCRTLVQALCARVHVRLACGAGSG